MYLRREATDESLSPQAHHFLHATQWLQETDMLQSSQKCQVVVCKVFLMDNCHQLKVSIFSSTSMFYPSTHILGQAPQTKPTKEKRGCSKKQVCIVEPDVSMVKHFLIIILTCASTDILSLHYYDHCTRCCLMMLQMHMNSHLPPLSHHLHQLSQTFYPLLLPSKIKMKTHFWSTQCPSTQQHHPTLHLRIHWCFNFHGTLNHFN